MPLHLVWVGDSTATALTALSDYWQLPEGAALPAWVDLKSGNHANFGDHPGLRAIAAVSQAAVAGSSAMPDLPRQQAGQDFYPSVMAMLARMAWQERRIARSVGPPAIG